MKNKIALDLFTRANSLYCQGRYEHALAVLQELVLSFPDNKTVLYAMALCLERLERQKESAHLCDRLIREFHFDKALILKARLITTPGEPEKESIDKNTVLVWPESMGVELLPQGGPPPKITDQSSSTIEYVMMGIAVLITFILFLLAAFFFAQGDTVVPGAQSTLFPARLLLFYGSTIFAAATIIIYGSAKITKKNSTPSVGITLTCGILFLFPFPGWILVPFIMCKYLEIDLKNSILITVLSITYCVLTVVTAAHVLELTTLKSIYLELVAGYG